MKEGMGMSLEKISRVEHMQIWKEMYGKMLVVREKKQYKAREK